MVYASAWNNKIRNIWINKLVLFFTWKIWNPKKKEGRERVGRDIHLWYLYHSLPISRPKINIWYCWVLLIMTMPWVKDVSAYRVIRKHDFKGEEIRERKACKNYLKGFIRCHSNTKINKKWRWLRVWLFTCY